jgi:MSHA pilin protein MshD
MRTRPARGFTLVEVIITIVLLAIAVGAVSGLVATLGRHSADPVLQVQGLYIAEGYLEEAQLRAYADPDGINEGCGANRDLWDDIGDYACLSTAAAPTDAQGNAIAALSRYRVRMEVGNATVVGGANTRRLEVQVTHLDGNLDVRLAALRAEY